MENNRDQITSPTTTTPVTRFGFGELGRQSLEEDKRRDEQERRESGNNVATRNDDVAS